MNNNNNKIGLTVRRRRQSKGWTQHELARAAGVSRRTIQYLESGLKMTHKGNLRHILKALG